MKLSQDQHDELVSLFQSPAWEALRLVMADKRSAQDSKVLSYNLSDGPDGLVIAKARSEGAKQLERDIATFAQELLKRQP